MKRTLLDQHFASPLCGCDTSDLCQKDIASSCEGSNPRFCSVAYTLAESSKMLSHHIEAVARSVKAVITRDLRLRKRQIKSNNYGKCPYPIRTKYPSPQGVRRMSHRLKDDQLVNSTGTRTTDHCAGRAHEDLKVEPGGPGCGVSQVQPNHFIEFDTASTSNLP